MRTTLLILMFGLLGTNALHAQNLLVNGNFNTTVPSNGTGGGWTSSNIQAGGWVTTSGNPFPAFILNQSGQMGTDPTIAQTVSSLTIGESYTVSGNFQIHVPVGALPNNSFGILLDGATLMDFNYPGNTNWNSFSASFIASNTTHTIALAAERNGSDYSYIVDNIQLTVAVPEPSVLLVLTSSALMAGVVYVKQRRRRYGKQ